MEVWLSSITLPSGPPTRMFQIFPHLKLNVSHSLFHPHLLPPLLSISTVHLLLLSQSFSWNCLHFLKIMPLLPLSSSLSATSISTLNNPMLPPSLLFSTYLTHLDFSNILPFQLTQLATLLIFLLLDQLLTLSPVLSTPSLQFLITMLFTRKSLFHSTDDLHHTSLNRSVHSTPLTLHSSQVTFLPLNSITPPVLLSILLLILNFSIIP